MMITIGYQKIVYKLKCITSATMNKKFGFAGQSLTVSYVMCTVFAYNFFFLNWSYKLQRYICIVWWLSKFKYELDNAIHLLC